MCVHSVHISLRPVKAVDCNSQQDKLSAHPYCTGKTCITVTFTACISPESAAACDAPPCGVVCCVAGCRWQSQHLVVDLLQLGREGFTPQLQQYLADCPELLWMSQVQARQYAGATGSLSKAASKASPADAQRLWCLMKLSVKAAGAKASGNAARLMATAGVQLRRLELQEQLLPGLAEPSASEALAAAALKAADQADDAAGSDQGAGGGVGLRGPDAAVAAVELLALDAANQGSESYRYPHSYRSADTLLLCAVLACILYSACGTASRYVCAHGAPICAILQHICRSGHFSQEQALKQLTVVLTTSFMLTVLLLVVL